MENAMSVDVEEYYQVSAFEPLIDRSQWPQWPSRVVETTERILQLFSNANIKATFFTLASVAQEHPQLIAKIVSEGHELASHGMSHYRITQQSQKEFLEDCSSAKKLLEDISGLEVVGYRAASYSLVEETIWAHDLLAEAGYKYSSSTYPIHHDLYGIPNGSRFTYKVSEQTDLLEIPLTTAKISGQNIPLGGGGYFRLMPYALYKKLLSSYHKNENKPSLFYFHPWEIDAKQPRPDKIPLKTRFRHYTNLARMEKKLEKLVHDFKWNRMDKIFLS